MLGADLDGRWYDVPGRVLDYLGRDPAVTLLLPVEQSLFENGQLALGVREKLGAGLVVRGEFDHVPALPRLHCIDAANLTIVGAQPNDKPNGGSSALHRCLWHLPWEDRNTFISKQLASKYALAGGFARIERLLEVQAPSGDRVIRTVE
jgi:hypothetical protein